MNKKLSEISRYKNMYLFLIPALATVIVFSYLPMVGIIMAFQDFNITLGYTKSPFVGLYHFKEFLDTPDFFRALKNTVGINSLMIIIGFPMPIIFALILNEIRGKLFKKISQTITYLPHFISWVVIGGLVYRVLDYDSGGVNVFRSLFGLEKIAFMREARYFWGVLIFVSIWKELGWNSIIYLASISSIDVNTYEAAIVDGAGRLKQLIYITLPGIAPIAGIMLIFTMGTLFSANGGASIDAIFNLRNALVSETAQVLDYYTYIEGVKWNHISYAAAIGLAQSIVSFGMVFAANTVSRKIKGYGAF